MAKKDQDGWLAGIYPQIVRRVGTEPTNRLKWLLNFFNTDGADGDVRIVNAELQFFMETLPTEGSPTLSEAQIKEMALELKKQLSNFFIAGVGFIVKTRGWVSHSFARDPFTMYLPKPSGEFWNVMNAGELRTRFDCEFPEDVFKMRAFELINRHVDTIGGCKECSKFFVRGRTDQEYCSTKCSQTVRSRRFEQKRRELKKGR